MACGTPVIATDVGGTREIIENNVNGWLVPFGDKEKLPNALLTCAAEPEIRRTFAIKGQQIVHSRLNAEKFIGEIESFFRHDVTEKNTQPLLRSAEN